MSVVFLVRPTLLSRVLVNDFQAIFFILLVLFSFSFLAKKKKKMNKLEAWSIAKERLETCGYRRFFTLKISLIVGFIFIFTRIMSWIVNAEIDFGYRKIGNFRFLFGFRRFQDPETSSGRQVWDFSGLKFLRTGWNLQTKPFIDS